MNGAERIAEERRRQVRNWGAEHDDLHTDEQLAEAASFYAIPEQYGPMMELWPWDPQPHKKDEYSRIHQLEVAGALIAAEIDRLLRI